VQRALALPTVERSRAGEHAIGVQLAPCVHDRLARCDAFEARARERFAR
jgi:hypothetical protein